MQLFMLKKKNVTAFRRTSSKVYFTRQHNREGTTEIVESSVHITQPQDHYYIILVEVICIERGEISLFSIPTHCVSNSHI